MSSIDELFRKPNVAPKRKLEDPTTTFSRGQPSKSAKLTNGSSPHSTTLQKQSRSPPRTATFEDEPPAEDEDDDMEAGPALPPDEEDNDEPGDDDEGRFFGSGVTDSEKQAMGILDQNDPSAADGDEAEETIDLTWLKRTALSFERKINKNAELRAKYADDPLKFMTSEAELDAEIKTMSLLSEYPALFADLVKSGSLNSLAQLLTHENPDIAISVVQMLEELTDEDTSATPEQWNTLTNALFDSDIVDLLISNLSRLDEANSEADRDAVYHIFAVLENLLSAPSNHDRIGANVALFSTLLKRIRTPDAAARHNVGQNRQYAAELLAILLQTSQTNRERVARQDDGLDTILQLLAPYRNGDPERDSDEEEFVENLFDCLTCLVEDAKAAESFVANEGVELCLIMLREGKLAKSRALKVLDHAMSGAGAVGMCDKLVEAAGLKTVFGLLMKTGKESKGNKSRAEKKGAGAALERESVEHLIGMLASLLRYTPAESPSRIRSLAKFVEKDYEKIERLVGLRTEYRARLARVEAQIEAERKKASSSLDEDERAELEDEWFSRRLDAGLYSLQTLDVVLSWLVAEDDGARKRIQTLLEANDGAGAGLEGLKKSLVDQLAGMDVDAGGGRDQRAIEGREMLEALVRCL
jgi:beta-catenin-like protein 1